MIIVGIDPGFTGAMAVITGDGHTVRVTDLPVMYMKNSSGKMRGAYNESALRDMLQVIAKQFIDTNVNVFLERQSSRPGQSAQSVFSTGHGLGLIRGMLVGLGIPYELVHPIVWKKVMGVTSDKNTSLAKAQALFPMCDLGHRKDAGSAEALLIAEYGRRLLTKSGQQANMEA